MRLVAGFAVVLFLAGCGSTAKQAEGLVVAKPDQAGRWTKLLLSPDAKTYLGQWSGECEIQTAYFVHAGGAKPRPLTDYTRGSAQSIAIGWVGAKARVRLPQGQPPERKPGVYLVDPKTMAMTLERPLQRGPGC